MDAHPPLSFSFSHFIYRNQKPLYKKEPIESKTTHRISYPIQSMGGGDKGKAVMALSAIDELKGDGRFDWELSFSNLDLGVPIFERLRPPRKVYQGTYCHQTVAIKEFNQSTYDRNEFLREVQILRKVRHKNIVQFIGVCANPNNNKLYIVSEFLSNGDLSSYMQKKYFFRRRDTFSTLEAVQIAIGVSKALCYMHKHNLIYRDLKPANLVMDEFKLVRICDFGVARVIDLDPSIAMAKETGTYAYMAPEVFSAACYSHKADVFSFGIVLWELLTGKRPYADRLLFGIAAATEAAKYSTRPKLPKKLSPVLSELIAQCWHQDDAQRPEFGDIIVALEEFATDLEHSKKISQEREITSLAMSY